MLYQTLSHTLKLAPHESPSSQPLTKNPQQLCYFYAKPSRKTLNKFGKPSTTLIIQKKPHKWLLFTPLMKLCLLLKLGKSKDVLKYICLSFVSFSPVFYFCCIYYFGSLIFCCQFVARTFIFDYFGLYPSFLVISLMHQNSAFPFVDSPSTYS